MKVGSIKTGCLSLKRCTVSVAIIGAVFLSAANAAIAQALSCGTPGDYDTFTCEPETEWFDYGAWINARVDYFIPTGLQPQNGWPVVFLFHGGSGNLTGVIYESKGYGINGGLKNIRGNSARTIKRFLEEGFAVIAPYAPFVNWQTNWPYPYT